MENVSVGIVTRNRAEFLRDCLFSLTKQTVSPLEVIVVNNASKDATKEVIDSFKTKLPIRYFVEPIQDGKGMPYGRNTLILEAKGDILAYIDDDCIASINWIKHITTAHKLNPQDIAIQGKSVAYKPNLVQKITELTYKNWIIENTYNKNYLFVVDAKTLSLKVKEIKKKKLYYDTNFSRGNDCDFSKLLLLHNEKIKYVPSIYVYHRERETLWDSMKQKYSNGLPSGMVRKKWPRYFFVTKYIRLEREKKFLNSFSYPYKFKVHLYLFLLKTAFNISYLLGQRSKYNYLALARKKIETSISIVIISNKNTSLSKLFSSLQFQTAIPKEILVIDTVKSKNIKDTIAVYKDKFQIRYFSTNFTHIESTKTQAISQAKGTIVLFMGNYSHQQNTWLEEIHYTYQFALHDIDENLSFLKKHTIMSHYTNWEYKNGKKYNSYNNKFALFILPPLSVKYISIGWFDLTFDNLLFNYDRSRYVKYSEILTPKYTEIVKTEFAKLFYRTKISLIDFLKHCYNKGRSDAIILKNQGKISKRKIIYANKYSKFLLPKRKFYFYPIISPFIFTGKLLHFFGFYSELSLLTYLDITGKRSTKIDFKNKNTMLSLSISIVINTYLPKNMSFGNKFISYIVKICILQNSKKKNLPYCYFCKGRYFWIHQK